MKEQGESIDRMVIEFDVVERRSLVQEIQNWRMDAIAQKSQEQLAATHFRQELENLRTNASPIAPTTEEELAATQYASVVAWLNVDESRQASISESIESELGRYPSTCDWVLHHQKVAAWLGDNEGPRILVIDGIPGSGKSTLAAKIGSFLRGSRRDLVISYFCTQSSAASTEYELFLKYILLRLCQSNPELVAYVHGQFIAKKTWISTPPVEQLIFTLADILSPSYHLYIILDGVDECSHESQSKLISMLKQLVSIPSLATCKVYLSGRISPMIAIKLGGMGIVSLLEEKASLRHAISEYTHQRVDSLGEQLRRAGMRYDDFNHVVQRIVENADGRDFLF